MDDNRSQDGAGAARRGFKGTAENAKTKLCQRWANGDCRFGDRCNFAHGEHELRNLPPRPEGGYGRGGGPGGGGYGGYGAPRGGYGGGPGFGGRGMGMGGRGGGWDDGYGGGGGYGGGYGGGGYGGGGYPPAGGGYPPQGGGYPPQGGPGGYGRPPPQQGPPGGYGAPPRGDAGGAPRPYGGPAEDPYAAPRAPAFPVNGPNGWVAYKTQDTGETYYHNHSTQSTQWDRPADWPNAPA